MNDNEVAFLSKLVGTPSPTGYEWPAAQVLRDRLTPVADTVETNVMGSVHATIKGTVPGAPTVLLAGHIDEVGMIVSYIDDNGFLAIKSLGGIDAVILPGLRVDVHASDGHSYRAVMGRKPIHLIDAEERKKVTPLDKLFVDMGMPADAVKAKVRVGDPITYGVGFERLGDGFAVSRAFDDKMGAFIAARVLEEVKAAGGCCSDFTAAGTVQEEIGMRGGQTSTFSVDPDIALCIEVGHATDYPDIEKRTYGDFKCGGGPIIARGPNINPVLFELLEQAAEKAGIPYQIEAENRGTGTDANPMQLTRGGKATALVSVPLRYMHTPTEVLKLSDIESAIGILTRFLLDLDPNIDFTPGSQASLGA